MVVLDSLEFGARTVILEADAQKPPEEIEQIQRERLQDLLRHARENSHHYAHKFAHIDGSKFELSELPTSTKAELMDNFDQTLTVDDVCRADVEEFFRDESNLGKLFRDKYVLSHTSGSQGQPLLLVQTMENVELLFALQASRGNQESVGLWEAAKRFMKPARLATVTLKPGFYPSATAFEYMPEGVKQFIEVLRVSLTDNDMLERLMEFRPTHLTAYASILHELARHAEEGRLQLAPELKQIVNISERLMPQAREHYQDVFGAPILDDYAMGECLFLSNGCTKSGGMHVNADWAILEVVDESNQPVPDGKKGAKVLVTNLANHVQPFIRYEIGDIVTMAADPCGCGSNLPLIANIDGRDSDMFYVETADGEQPLSPTIFELALSRVLDAREYQLVQEENDHIRVRIEPLPGVEFDREHANQVLHEQLGDYGLDQQVQLDIEVVDRLAPDEDGKFKRVVSKVGRPGTEADENSAARVA
jgi:phenylacetate-coenzyme A ligase PaaK-like adenylate-forming protein